MKIKLATILLSMSLATFGCSDDVEIIGSGGGDDAGVDDTDTGGDDTGGDDTGGDDTGGDDPVENSYLVEFTNLTTNQPMTAPVAAIHDDSINLYELGAIATDEIRDIAETGDNTGAVAFAMGAGDLVSAAGEVGATPILPGNMATIMFTSSNPDHVFSLVNMVICTNDGITGVDSIPLPTDATGWTLTAVAYDAGTRMNMDDANSFFPPPCSDLDPTMRTPPPEENPRLPIGAHPGQAGVINTPAAGGNWDFMPTDDMISVTMTLVEP